MCDGAPAEGCDRMWEGQETQSKDDVTWKCLGCREVEVASKPCSVAGGVSVGRAFVQCHVGPFLGAATWWYGGSDTVQVLHPM